MKHITKLTIARTLALVGITTQASMGAIVTAYYDFEGTGADRFDDPAGAFADDLDGGQASAVFSTDTAGAFAGSQSVSFDGSYTLFTDAYTTDLRPGVNAFTIAFWIKAADSDQENTNTRLLSTRVQPDGSGAGLTSWQIEGFGNNGSNGDLMDLRMRDTTDTQFLVTNDATNALARDDQSETATWRHVAFVVSNTGNPNDGGAFAKTFVDGSQVGGILNPNTLFDGTEIGNDLGQFIIGGDAEGNSSRHFTGLLDDVALFDGVVDDAQIAQLAAGTLNPLSIPEPSAALLGGLGLLALLRRRR